MNKITVLTDKTLEILVEQASKLKVKKWKACTENLYGKLPVLSFYDKQNNPVNICVNIEKVILENPVGSFYAVHYTSESELPVAFGLFITEKLNNEELLQVLKKSRQLVCEKLKLAGF